MRLKRISCNEVKVGQRFRKDLGDLQGLANSIEAEGLLHPIGLTADDELVFGYRRLCAVRDILEWDQIEAVTVNVSSITAGEYAENEVRKDFTMSERVAIGQALEETTHERRGRPKKDGDEKAPNAAELKGQETREIAAERAGFGGRTTYAHAKTVVDKGSVALVDAMDAGDVAPSVAAKLAELPKKEQTKAVKGGKPAVRAAVKTEKLRVEKPGELHVEKVGELHVAGAPLPFGRAKELERILKRERETIRSWPEEYRSMLSDGFKQLAKEALSGKCSSGKSSKQHLKRIKTADLTRELLNGIEEMKNRVKESKAGIAVQRDETLKRLSTTRAMVRFADEFL